MAVAADAPTTRVELRGSHRARPPDRRLRKTAATTPIEVQVYLRATALPRLLASATRGERQTRETLARTREAALDKPYRTVERFAARHGLAVVAREPARRMIRLAGSVAALEAAFGAQLHDYAEGDRRYRARSGSLFASRAVARIVESVLGFGTRPVVKPMLGDLGPAAPEGGHPPGAFAQLYDFPPGQGAGQRIALLQFGGQYYPADTADAFAAMGLAVPVVLPISVSGAQSSPEVHFDREIALDLQIAGAIAPAATFLLYFGPAGNGGFVETLSHAVHDTVNQPTIISISFGDVEEAWDDDAIRTLSGVLTDAAHLGITVIAATGDMRATAGYSDGQAHVAYPASDPHVLACGGTTLRAAVGVPDEAVWNTGGWGTGGGVSARFQLPDYQASLAIPRHATSGKKGRGVPDVAAIADSAVGYRIRCRGVWRAEGGTSAAAPLWAGLIARINAGKGHNLGFAHPRLYAAAQGFNAVTAGDNIANGIGYPAGAGWNACTGLGSPKGRALYDAL